MAGEVYDVAIVGSGAAGRGTAVQAAWSGLRTLVLGGGFEADGRLMLTNRLESYPGFAEGVGGPELADALEAQAARLGAHMRPVDVMRADLSGRPFRLWAEGEGEPTLARTVIVATGATPTAVCTSIDPLRVERGFSNRREQLESSGDSPRQLFQSAGSTFTNTAVGGWAWRESGHLRTVPPISVTW